MLQNHLYNQCPVCGQGELLVVKDLQLNKFLIMCDDCESSWNDPESAKYYNKCLPRSETPVRDATEDEIKDLGWVQYVKGDV